MSASAFAPSPFTAKDKIPDNKGIRIRNIKIILSNQKLKVKTKKAFSLYLIIYLTQKKLTVNNTTMPKTIMKI